MKITEHIYFYPCIGESLARPSNTTVIIGKDKQIIIDPGIDICKRLDNLIADIQKDGLNIDNTTEIWLTHAHIDHFDIIYNLFKRFGGQRLVRCHPLGKSILSDSKLKKTFMIREAKKYIKYASLKDGKKVSSETKQMIWGMAKKEIRNYLKKSHIDNIEPFFNGEIVNIFPIEIQIIFLPGHVPDEIGFWIVKEKLLILGDLIFIAQRKGKTIRKIVLNNSYSDLGQALKSLETVRQIREKETLPEILLAAHSDPVWGKENIQEIFERLLLKIDDYRAIAEDFAKKNQNFKGNKLVRGLGKILPDENLLDIEKYFIAEGILKFTGVIK